MEWSKESIMMDMVCEIRTDIHGDIYGHEFLAERLADHIKYLKDKVVRLEAQIDDYNDGHGM